VFSIPANQIRKRNHKKKKHELGEESTETLAMNFDPANEPDFVPAQQTRLGEVGR